MNRAEEIASTWINTITSSQDEIAELASTFNSMTNSLKVSEEENRKAKQKLLEAHHQLEQKNMN